MPLYGYSLYGSSTYGGTVEPRSGGARVVHAHLYRATIDNVFVEDLSEYFVGGDVTMNIDRDVFYTAQIAMTNPGAVNPYEDYLAPVIHFLDSDGRDSGHIQLGLYALRVPPQRRTTREEYAVYQGEDLMSVLMGSAYTDADSVTAGTNVRTEAIATAAEAGLSRVIAASTSRTVTTTRSYAAGTSRKTKLDSLSDLIAWSRPYADREGFITFPGEYKSPSQRPTFATWTEDDIGLMNSGEPAIDVQPRDEVPRNIVVVVKDNPNEAPLVGTATNDDPSSPSSTVRTGVERVRREVVNEAQTQADVDAVASRLLTEERLRYQTMRFDVFTTLIPDPYSVVDLPLTGRLSDLAGTWTIRNWRLGFTHQDAVLSVEASQTRNEAGDVL